MAKIEIYTIWLAQANQLEVIDMKKKVMIQVEGMHCPMCEKNLTRALKESEGVKKAKVSLEKKNALVVFDDAKTDEAKIKAAVNEAGYQAL